MSKIHCPICNGTGRIISSYGSVACLNCLSSGIVENDSEQQRIIENKKNEVENQRKRKEQEEYENRIKAEKVESERQISIAIQEAAHKEKQNITAVIVICAILALIFVIVINWDAILAFLKELLNMVLWIIAGIFGVVFLLAIVSSK
jgi:hypothetical protein